MATFVLLGNEPKQKGRDKERQIPDGIIRVLGRWHPWDQVCQPEPVGSSHLSSPDLVLPDEMQEICVADKKTNNFLV